MIREFEGKTEKEAINVAVAELGLKQGEFDVEIVEMIKKSGFFSRGTVKIRVHTSESEERRPEPPEDSKTPQLPEDRELGEKLIAYLEKILDLMGFPGKVKVLCWAEQKIFINIESDHSNILIGRKGKNLDALQVLVSIYAGRLGCNRRVILDLESYRKRREENLIKVAQEASREVLKSRSSQVLEPMNPFDRRLIHTALNDIGGISTKSEGTGLLKRVRISYKEE